ncbi:AP-5 complex subunit mu-1 isoform X2 [Mus musculus]|uniref:AP-5 complex subunit mu-1 isoform X2 n=1 Tax=Mus musculus TaxID=10090 RepID=UPI00001E8D78|nr:AP-5 complex subunit mu-1 isoform X2 [Mus musculus]XP_036014774.1 AP-5 complex subunit mu-1 isoform X2 [Mus musculus]|eukprot:XP_006519687.1 PREDICTED: AP-5 complex subunit mu-1 isoform X2 [Mus musculus]
MALRAVWLIRHEPGTPLGGTVRFSRRYPTVEKRAKAFNGMTYVPVPEDGPFLRALLFQLRLLDDDKDFMERRDGCSRINKTSIYGLSVGGEELWPVIAFLRDSMIYASVPLVEQALSPRPPLISISGVSQGLELLLGIQDFLYSSQKNDTDLHTKLSQLPDLLLQACPLGTLLDANLQNSLNSINSVSVTQPQKQPAWKVGAYKGKAQISISITETVKCMQYGKQDIADTWQVAGTVACKVPVPPILGSYHMKEEGVQLKVTVNFKLHESVRNNFEVCEAHIPFYNRGPITHLEYKASFGQLEVFREKSLLVWIIGQKFPKSMEISLSGTLTFGVKGHNKQPFDHICIGNTAYIKLNFRIADYTLTGCYADQHSVQVFASGKPKISAYRKLISSDYYIWNSKAPAPVTYASLLP